MSTLRDIQYIGGYHDACVMSTSGMFSTSEGYREYVEGYYEYIEGDNMSTSVYQG